MIQLVEKDGVWFGKKVKNYDRQLKGECKREKENEDIPKESE